MADDEFSQQAAAIAIAAAEETLIEATRQYQDAARYGDAQSGADALSYYTIARQKYEALINAGSNNQQNAGQQLSEPTRRFLQKRIDAGEQINDQTWQEYLRGHHAAVGAGFTPDSDSYFRCVEGHLTAAGLGKPPLDATEAAKISGLSPNEYNQQARKFAQLKARGYFQDQ